MLHGQSRVRRLLLKLTSSTALWHAVMSTALAPVISTAPGVVSSTGLGVVASTGLGAVSSARLAVVSWGGLGVVAAAPSPGPASSSSGFDASSFFTGAAVATVLAAIIGAWSAWRRAKKERAESLEDQRSKAREDAVRRQRDAGQELQGKAISLAEAAVLGYAGKTSAEIAAPGTELVKAWQGLQNSAREAWTTLGAKDDELTPLMGAVNAAVKGLLDSATAGKVDAPRASASLDALNESVIALGQRALEVQQTKGGSE